MSTTESPFSLTIKVGPNNDLLTGRADTAEEMSLRISQLKQLAAALQGAGTAPVQQPAQQHVQTLADAGIAATVVSTTGGAIEEKTDRFNNRYVKGEPNGQSCVHGPRVTAHKTSKAGKPYIAYVCVNDSPFGDYKAGKCDQVYPPRD